MGFFNWLNNWWDDARQRIEAESHATSIPAPHLAGEYSGVNPATGLPMAGSLDIQGNPYGVDLQSQRDAFARGTASATVFVPTSISGAEWKSPAINPATCLPMVGDVDVDGNPYGADFRSRHDACTSTDGSNDSWTQSSSTDWDYNSYSSFTDTGGGGSSWD